MEIALYLTENELETVKQWSDTKIFHEQMEAKIDLGVSYGTNEYTRLLSTNKLANLDDIVFSVSLLSELSARLNDAIEAGKEKQKKVQNITKDQIKSLFRLSWKDLLLTAVITATGENIAIRDQQSFDICYTFITSTIDYLQFRDEQNLSVEEVVNVAFNQMITIIRYRPFEDGNKRVASLCYFLILEKLYGIKITLSNSRFEVLVKTIYRHLLDDKVTPIEKVREIWTAITKAEIYTLAQFETEAKNEE